MSKAPPAKKRKIALDDKQELIMEFLPNLDLIKMIQEYEERWLFLKCFDNEPTYVSEVSTNILSQDRLFEINYKGNPYFLEQFDYLELMEHQRRSDAQLEFINAYPLGRNQRMSWSFQLTQCEGGCLGVCYGVYLPNGHNIYLTVTGNYELFLDGQEQSRAKWPHYRSDPDVEEKDLEEQDRTWWTHFYYCPLPETNTFEFKVAFAPQRKVLNVSKEDWKDIVPCLDPLWLDLDWFQHAVPFFKIGQDKEELRLRYFDQEIAPC